MIKKTGGYVKDILKLMDEPTLHNNTVETMLKILDEKNFERLNSNVVSFVVDKKQMSIEDLELVLKELKNKLIYLLKIDALISKAYCHKVFT